MLTRPDLGELCGSAAADDALAPLAAHESLLLAVSGGPDSVALMLLAARWSARDRRRLYVATVDHGLRAESRAEAESVGQWAAALGLPHALLTWSGDKPATRIQERAREARYALLAEHARKVGATAIVTAHHGDDQAETILFRLTRGSGVAGLAGMARETPLDGLTLLRPLLAYPKAELVDICRAAGHPFCEDPSNISQKYARARLRDLAPLLAAQGLDREALLRLGARAARANAALADATEKARRGVIREMQARETVFDAAGLAALPLEILQRTLAAEIARIAPDAPLRLERLERAALRLAEALASGAPLRLTIAELLLEARGETVTLRPAPARRAPPG